MWHLTPNICLTPNMVGHTFSCNSNNCTTYSLPLFYARSYHSNTHRAITQIIVLPTMDFGYFHIQQIFVYLQKTLHIDITSQITIWLIIGVRPHASQSKLSPLDAHDSISLWRTLPTILKNYSLSLSLKTSKTYKLLLSYL